MYLDLRDRLLIAKVAYVGAEASGKRANFAALQKSGSALAETFAGDSTSLSLDVQALERSSRFDDCALRVRLVAHRGRPSSEAVRTLLDDADGVVVVVDATPSAHGRNRASVDVVRAALSERPLPVVVQVNKTDLDDALGTEEVVESLALGTWPHVVAVASNGDGVEETLNRVVNDVIQSMTQPEHDDQGTSTAAEHRSDEGHPLLAALRRVLEANVEGHAARVADSLAARIEQRVGERIDRLAERISALEHGHQDALTLARGFATREDVEVVAATLREPLAAAEKYTTAVNERVAALEVGAETLRHHLVTCGDELLKSARHATTREDLATATADLLEELVRITDASSSAGRDQLTAVAATLRRSIDAVGSDVMKKAAPKEAFADIVTRLERLDERARQVASSIEGSSAPLTSLTKVVEGDATIVRELRDSVGRRLAAIDLAVRELASQTEGSGALALERTARVEALIAELIEELRKPKKGWFG